MEFIKNNIYKIVLLFDNKKYEYIFKFNHLDGGWLYADGYVQLYNNSMVDYSSEKNNLILDLNYSEFEILNIFEDDVYIKKIFDKYIEF